MRKYYNFFDNVSNLSNLFCCRNVKIDTYDLLILNF